MVVADNNVWDEYLKADANVRSCRVKSIPCFKDLCTIYEHVMEGKCRYCGISSNDSTTNDCEQRVPNETTSTFGTRTRTCWHPPVDRYFINLMLAHEHKGNQFEGVFRKQAWMEMISSFNENFGLEYNSEILKNRYKTLRRQYNLIKSLLQSDGFAWDETCQIVLADDCVWKDYLKVRINIRNLLGN
uniref:Myb/SANT-like domain-containing protein n=1 Tax=Cajanus cajan TaxID=3821 RepID=A0A151S835_CAJCA|nr:hypothetical protein KK1_027186 [Cajanus cajan]